MTPDHLELVLAAIPPTALTGGRFVRVLTGGQWIAGAIQIHPGDPSLVSLKLIGQHAVFLDITHIVAIQAN